MESFWNGGWRGKSPVRASLPAVGAGQQPLHPARSGCPPQKPAADVVQVDGAWPRPRRSRGGSCRPLESSLLSLLAAAGEGGTDVPVEVDPWASKITLGYPGGLLRHGQAQPWCWSQGPSRSCVQAPGPSHLLRETERSLLLCLCLPPHPLPASLPPSLPCSGPCIRPGWARAAINGNVLPAGSRWLREASPLGLWEPLAPVLCLPRAVPPLEEKADLEKCVGTRQVRTWALSSSGMPGLWSGR